MFGGSRGETLGGGTGGAGGVEDAREEQVQQLVNVLAGVETAGERRELTREQEQQLGEKALTAAEQHLREGIESLKGEEFTRPEDRIAKNQLLSEAYGNLANVQAQQAAGREALAQEVYQRIEQERQPDMEAIRAKAAEIEEREDAEIDKITNGRTAEETVAALDKVIEKLQGEITHMESVYADPSMKDFQEKMIAEARAELAEKIRQRNLVESSIVEIKIPLDEQAAGGELEDNTPRGSQEVTPRPVAKKAGEEAKTKETTEGATEADVADAQEALESESGKIIELTPEKRQELVERAAEKMQQKKPKLLKRMAQKAVLVAMAALMMVSLAACGQAGKTPAREVDTTTFNDRYGSTSAATEQLAEGALAGAEDLTADTRHEFGVGGTRYDYSYDFESTEKHGPKNFGVDKSFCAEFDDEGNVIGGDRELTTTEFMFICQNQPETLAANVAAFPSIVKAVFGEELSPEQIDARLSDPNNTQSGYEQGALLAALEEALRDPETNFYFYNEHNKERSYYIMGGADTAAGEENDPNSLYLGLDQVNRSGEAQVQITIAVRDKMGNIIGYETGDYNMPCGFQRNIEYVRTAVPVKEEGGPGTSTPANTDPGTTNPGTTDPGTTDPGTTDPGTTDPGTTDPGNTDPGTTDPGTTDPGTTDPGTTDPGTPPGDTDPDKPDPTPPGTTDPTTPATAAPKSGDNEQRIADKITQAEGVVHSPISSDEIGDLTTQAPGGMFGSDQATTSDGGTVDLGNFVPTTSDSTRTEEQQQQDHQQQLTDDRNAERPNENGQASISQNQDALNDYFQSILQQTEDRAQQAQDLQDGIDSLQGENFTNTADQIAQDQLLSEAYGGLAAVEQSQQTAQDSGGGSGETGGAQATTETGGSETGGSGENSNGGGAGGSGETSGGSSVAGEQGSADVGDILSQGQSTISSDDLGAASSEPGV